MLSQVMMEFMGRLILMGRDRPCFVLSYKM